MKKIRNKIMSAILGAIVLTAVVLSTVSVNSTLNASIDTTKATLGEAAVIAAQTASNTIGNYTVAVGEIATNNVLISSESSVLEKREFIDTKTTQYYMRSGGMLDENGIDIFKREDHSNSSFFIGAKSGGAFFSEPIITPDGTDAYIAVSAPVMDGNNLVGVVYFYCDTVVLQDLVENVAIGETGSAYILDSTGNTIAYNDYSLVLNQTNSIMLSLENPEDQDLAMLAELEQSMINGETSVGSYTYEGATEYQAYAPIPGTNGWSIAVSSAESELLAAAFDSVIVIAILCAVMIAIGLVIAHYTSTSISKPIVLCVTRLNALAEGDLTSPMPEVNTKDETRQLVQSTGDIIASLSDIIFDLDSALSQMANGILNIDMPKQSAYIGDYNSLHTSIIRISDSLSTTINEISNATSQVNLGGEQVAAGAQVLASGATQQASSIEELASTIDEITKQSVETAKDAQVAREANDRSQKALVQSNNQMQEMLAAMREINEKATLISNIVKDIDEIAFQTNILALNAAVEAARAGAAGKGFAIVADEVRNLAAKSAESAQSTALLIEETIAVVRSGNKIANETSQSIALVSSNAVELGELVDGIADSISGQADAAAQINMGMEQIASVVQSNSATAEESAATSQELSAQANRLKILVERFRF